MDDSQMSLILTLIGGPIAALIGYVCSTGGGLSRLGVWIYFLVVIAMMLAVPQTSGEGAVFLGLCFSGALGSRARNAKYPPWAAAIAGLPVISFPLVILLMFSRSGRVGSRRDPSQESPPSTEKAKAESVTMKLEEYSLTIPEAYDLEDGYAVLEHGQQYTLKLSNDSDRACDVVVKIDGRTVGGWRVEANDTIEIERPSGDTGRFTFFRHGSQEAEQAELEKNNDLGLVSAEFRPERQRTKSFDGLEAAPLSDAGGLDAGGTGLTGESSQRSTKIAALEFDEKDVRTIHLRLVAKKAEVRPLHPKSTPVPPPVA